MAAKNPHQGKNIITTIPTPAEMKHAPAALLLIFFLPYKGSFPPSICNEKSGAYLLLDPGKKNIPTAL